MLESRISTDRRVVFREPFTPDSIAKNGGVITGGVTLNNGVATFDGTGYIDYPAFLKNIGNTFNVRFRRTSTTRGNLIALGSVVGLGLICFNFSSNDNMLIFLANNFYRYFTGLNPYLDGEWHYMQIYCDDISINNWWVCVDGVALTPGAAVNIPPAVTWNNFSIGRHDVYGDFIGDMDLFEVYQGELTPEECSLISQNKLYAGCTNDGLSARWLANGSLIDLIGDDNLSSNNTSIVHDGQDVRHILGVAGSYLSYSNIDFGLTSFSYCISGKSIGSTGAHQCFFGKGGGGYHLIGFYSTLSLNMLIQGLNTTTFVPSFNFSDGIPRRYVFIYDADANFTYIYMNGELVASKDQSGKTPIAVTSSGIIGSYTTTGYNWNGYIDDAMIYKARALTAEEVMQDYAYARHVRGWVK